MKKLIVAEVFYSLQCEGAFIGQPAVFLRLGGCNLLCQSESWVCDTIEVWKKGKAKEFEDIIPERWVKRLKDGAHLVITGGEPLMQQKSINQYLLWFHHRYNFNPFIEVETNGTIVPDLQLNAAVQQWNVSPKLSNSGEPFEKRYNDIAILHFNFTVRNTIFKFVVKTKEDILEALNDYPVDISKVVFMPAGSTREELEKVRLFVVEQCINLNVRYSERLHIVIWNQKTGV